MHLAGGARENEYREDEYRGDEYRGGGTKPSAPTNLYSKYSHPPGILVVYYYQQRTILHSPEAFRCDDTPALRLRAKAVRLGSERRSMRDTRHH